MTKSAQNRAQVLIRVAEKRLSLVNAAKLLGVSERQVKRLYKAFSEKGVAGLVSKKRGKPSNHQLPKILKAYVIHLPLIKIVPKQPLKLAELNAATHIIVTSKTTVALAKEHFQKANKPFISVGKATTAALQAIGIQHILTATSECQEGIIELLEALKPVNPLFFWPHSSSSRPILNRYFEEKGYAFIERIGKTKGAECFSLEGKALSPLCFLS